MIELFLAFIAGILTIAAPCILLPLPILLGASVGQSHKARPLFITAGFVVTFSALGISINLLVRTLGIDPTTLRHAAVVLLSLFALFMIWPTPFERAMQHMSGLIAKAAKTGQRAGSGNWGGFVMGVIIGVVWAPCAGPILGSILTLIAQESESLQAFALLVAYSLGAGVPMLLIAYGSQALSTKIKVIAQYATRLQQVFGVILLLVAASIYFQYDTKIQAYLVEQFPVFGTTLENKIQKQLAPTPTPSRSSAPAPEFSEISTWLNTPEPVTLSALRGKVVLVDFWTYSCINCVRTLPYITKLYETYKDQGLVVIGVHTPEFAFEKDKNNVAKALTQYDITYPVALDIESVKWNNYDNQYWPAKYLVDQQGNIVYTHFGEGAYTETENAVRKLLGLSTNTTLSETPKINYPQTPEIYFGTNRLEYFAYSTKPSFNATEYVIPNRLSLNYFALSGTWQFSADKTKLTKPSGTIKLHFQGKTVYMVAASPEKAQSVTVRADSGENATVQISEHTLYPLLQFPTAGEHTIEISIPAAGFEVYTFTFG